MVTIKNTLDKDLSLQFKGETYTLGAGVTDKFPADVAARWIEIYGFLSIAGTSDKEVDKVVEEITGEEMKPKKRGRKKKEDKE